MTETPFDFGRDSHLWVISPDGRRVGYVDPETAGPTVREYHAFDAMITSSITWNPRDGGVDVSVRGVDGTVIELRVALSSNIRASVLNVLVAVTPKVLARTPSMISVGESLASWLLGIEKLRVATPDTPLFVSGTLYLEPPGDVMRTTA